MSESSRLARTKDVAKSKLSRHGRLLLILVVAFGLRIGFMLFYTPVISGDGCEYVRMGMEIRDHKPVTGIFDWPETMYGSLFPVLIAGVSKLGLSAEAAAYLLALASGMALIVVAYLLVRYVYGDRAALWAALLFALFPLFIGLAGSVFNESIYLTLWLAGVYWTVRALDSFRLKDFLLTGLFWGLATLSRPEAFAYVLFVAAAAVVIGTIRRTRWLQVIGGIVAPLTIWVALMVPYALFQHAHTGHYRFEGKWNINYTLGKRIDSGMNYYQAGFGLDQQMHPVGPLLDSSLYAAYTPYDHSIRAKLVYFVHRIRRNWMDTYETVTSVDFGGPPLFLLLILGLFATEWTAERARREFVIAVMALSMIVVMATAANLEFRYAYPLPLILLIWAAAGIDPLIGWTRRTVSSWGNTCRSFAGPAATVMCFGTCALLLAFAAVGFRTNGGFRGQQKEFVGIEQAGLWLASHAQKPLRIAGFEGRVAYYAGSSFVIFPYADSNTVLQYLESKHVEYVALDSAHCVPMPTLNQWFQNGIPDAGARLVYESTQGSKDRIRIYRLEPSQSARNLLSKPGSAKE